MAKKRNVKSTKDTPKSIEEENKIYHQVFEEISRFIQLIGKQDEDIADAEIRLAEKKLAYEAAKKEVDEARQARDGSKHGLYRLLAPIDGGEVLPLFDRMEPADDDLHGEGAAEWRKEPIGALGLSLPSQIALNSADILFVGQLQDAVLAAPTEWWEKISGLTYGSSCAIVDSLNQFVADRSGGK